MPRYSQLYIPKLALNADSDQARLRMAVTFDSLVGDNPSFRRAVKRLIGRGLGLPVPAVAPGDGLDEHFSQCKREHLLDTVTLVAEAWHIKLTPARVAWITEVDQIFREENLAYRVGEDGIVRPHIDEEFDANQSSALRALDEERFAEARDDFEKAFQHLRNGEGKQALRMMFPAVEVAAKVLFPGKFSRLMPNELDSTLRPLLDARYADNEPARDASRQLLEAFKKWINSSQLYRHGQEVQASAEPPQELVVLHLSLGASFLRWMIETVSAHTPSGPPE